MRSGPPGHGRDGGDCRCLCGSLLARVVAGGVELRCRRCKRTVVVPLESDRSVPAAAAGRVRRAG